MKKLLSMFAMLLMVLNVSAYGFEVDGIYYNITSDEEKEVEVKYRSTNKYSGDVIIPEKITYNENEYSVTRIGAEAFWSCSSLTSITIPESVTSIGGYAFAECPNMTELYYNAKNAIISKDSGYLSFPKTLTKVVIGEKVESIPAYFVYGCNELTSITIPESVTSIGSYVFAFCM